MRRRGRRGRVRSASASLALVALVCTVGGCASRGDMRFAVAPPAEAAAPPTTSADPETPTSYVSARERLRVTLVGGVGLPLIAVEYPAPVPWSLDRDGRTLILLVAGVADAPGDAAAVHAWLAAAARAEGLDDHDLEIDALFLQNSVGDGLAALAELIRDPHVRLRTLAHTGAVARSEEGQLSGVFGSGLASARRHAEDPEVAPAMRELLAAALAEQPPAACERLFLSKPLLQATLPDFGSNEPRFELRLPARDLLADGADRANPLALEVVYGDFTLLLPGDADPRAQAELAALGDPATGQDATAIVLPAALAGETASVRWTESLDVQVGLFLGSAVRNPPPELLARLRPGTFHATQTQAGAGHLVLDTDGEVFRVARVPRTGERPVAASPWRRALSPVELEGLLAPR